MSISPAVAAGGVVSVMVKIDGAEISNHYLLRQVEIDLGANRLPTAQIAIADGSVSEQDFAAASSGDFLPGRTIEIFLGYDSKLDPVFSGRIRRNRFRMAERGEAWLEVDCCDPAIVLTLSRATRLFAGRTDAEVLSEIISDAGLTPDVAISGDKVAHRVQQDATDWDYLVTRARLLGAVVTVANGTVRIAPPAFPDPVLRLSFGESITRLDLETDAAEQMPGTRATTWDSTGQAPSERTGQEPHLSLGGLPSAKGGADALRQPELGLSSAAALTPEDLTDWADARLLQARLAWITGKIGHPGHAGPTVGSQVELDGLGRQLDGLAWVSSVHHRVTAGQWSTELGLGLRQGGEDGLQSVTAPPAAGVNPGATGLQIAKVLQVHEDPLGEHRIKVALPLADGGDAGQWVRMAAPYAGVGVGVRFLPEIGDEVVLGFLQGDPNAAVMLGALHSGTRAPPTIADVGQAQKAIVTPSGLRVGFNDAETVLTVDTPGGRSVVLDDTDGSVVVTDAGGSQMRLDAEGVTLSAQGDLALEATGQVMIAGQSLSAVATSDAVLKGMDVTVEADATLTAKANASTDISASGPVTVKGLPINLN